MKTKIRVKRLLKIRALLHVILDWNNVVRAVQQNVNDQIWVQLQLQLGAILHLRLHQTIPIKLLNLLENVVEDDQGNVKVTTLGQIYVIYIIK